MSCYYKDENCDGDANEVHVFGMSVWVCPYHEGYLCRKISHDVVFRNYWASLATRYHQERKPLNEPVFQKES